MTETSNQTIFPSKYFLFYEKLLEYTFSAKDEIYPYFQQNAQNFTLILLLYYVTCCVFYYVMSCKGVVGESDAVKDGRNVLFVTSHPDDECMFFGPTILAFTQTPAVNVYLLCLSKGDYYGEGRTRKDELWSSCEMLGIPPENVQLVVSQFMPDNPNIMWPAEHVAHVMLEAVQQRSIDTLITFDKLGVSRHKNHSAVFYGLAQLCLDKKLPKTCRAYTLETVSLPRKYSLFFDAFLSFLSTASLIMVTPSSRSTLLRAMRCHASQLAWFRRLYMTFSRYTYLNTLQRVELLDLELELEYDDE